MARPLYCPWCHDVCHEEDGIVPMGMNLFSAQLAMPAQAPPAEAGAKSFESMKSREPVRGSKSFDSALRTARQEGRRSDARRTDDVQPSHATESQRRTTREDKASVTTSGRTPQAYQEGQGTGMTEQASLPEETPARNIPIVGGEVISDQGTESTGFYTNEDATTDSSASWSPLATDLLFALNQVLPQQAQVHGTPALESTESESGTSDDGVLSATVSDDGEATSFTTPTDQSPEVPVEESETEVVNEEGIPVGDTDGARVSKPKQDPVPFETSMHPQEGEVSSSHHDSTVPHVGPNGLTSQIVSGEKSPQPETSSQDPPQSIPHVSLGDRRSRSDHDLPRSEEAVSESIGAVEQPVRPPKMDGVVVRHGKMPAQILPHEDVGEADSGLGEARQSTALSSTAALSDMNVSDEGGGRQFSSNEPPWPMPEQNAAPQSVQSAEHQTDTVVAGPAMASQSRPTEPVAPSTPDRMQTLTPAPAAETHVPTTSRAVLFQVAEPDLGQINVRVTLAKEVVHAYLSSDRPEVGQVLINSQDRLQTALHANGLEMGQFRVDIDRQGSGRSFQQGQSQEHNGMWQSSSTGPEEDHGTARSHDYRSAGYNGMLNVVA